MTDIKSQIDDIINARYVNPGPFNIFADNLLTLGISRFSYDVMADELRFYSEKEMAHSLKRNDLTKASQSLARGKPFDVCALEQAIHKFDSGQTTPAKFHEEVSAAGVMFCSVFLKSKRILYLGAEGHNYWEEY